MALPVFTSTERTCERKPSSQVSQWRTKSLSYTRTLSPFSSTFFFVQASKSSPVQAGWTSETTTSLSAEAQRKEATPCERFVTRRASPPARSRT